MVVKAVLFDLDGTLIDSKDSFIGALNVCLKKIGLRPLKDIKFDKPIKDIIKRYVNENKTVEEVLACYQICYSKFWKKISVIEGANDILDWLNRENIKIGVVTDRRSLISYVKPTLESLDLYRYIDILVTLNDVTKSKPDPEPFLFAASRLNIDPSSCIVVGDLPEDIISGKKAGMRTIAYLNGYAGEKILNAGPDFSIDNLVDLKKIFIYLL